MDFVAFYVIVQGPLYKNGIFQINFGNIFLFSPYLFHVGIFLPHLQQPRNEKKRLCKVKTFLIYLNMKC
jgi:hypothetical protein